MNITKTILLLLMLVCFYVDSIAQTDKKETILPWYIGVKAGVPFGISTFTSFGNDKINIGYNVGILGRYKLNPFISFDLSAALGGLKLGHDNYYANSWLGADGEQYLAPVTGMEGYYYNALYSSLMLQQYGLHLNINVAPFFSAKKNNRLSINVSPATYAVLTQTTIKTIENDNTFIKNDVGFGFGLGGDISVGYEVTRQLAITLSTGINYVLGTRLDGLQKSDHGNNFIVNNNISIIWNIGHKPVKPQVQKAPPPPPPPIQKKPVRQSRPPIKKVKPKRKKASLPIIYFAVDDIDVIVVRNKIVDKTAYYQIGSHNNIATITSYAHPEGIINLSEKYSNPKAEIIKNKLMAVGVDPTRIQTQKDYISKTPRQVGYNQQKNSPRPSQPRKNEAMLEVPLNFHYKPKFPKVFPIGNFSRDEAEIIIRYRPEAIKKALALLKETPEMGITIVGYLNDDITAEIAIKYSQQKITIIKTILIEEGIDPKRIETLNPGLDTRIQRDASINQNQILSF